MTRTFTMQYAPDGNFWIIEKGEDGNARNPGFGPFPREEAIFELGRLGVPDYSQVRMLLDSVTGEIHDADFEIKKA